MPHVLLVLEDPDVRQEYAAALEAAGCRTATAGCVGEALEQLRARPYSVVVSELILEDDVALGFPDQVRNAIGDHTT